MLNIEQYDRINYDITVNVNNFINLKYKKQHDVILHYFIKTLNTKYPIIMFDNINLNNYKDLTFDKPIVCYSQNMLYHIYEIANTLADITNKYDIQISTIIPYKLFDLFIDFKKILSCNNLINKFPIYKMIFENDDKNEKITYGNRNINSNLLLMQVYDKLMDPAYYKNWDQLIKDEYNIFKTTKLKNINFKITISDQIKEITFLIFTKLIYNNDKIILTGENGINIMLNLDKKLSYTMEIISELKFKDIYNKIVEIFKNNGIDDKIFYQIESLNIINDNRLKRLTLYIFKNGRKQDILYCYNSTQYKLISTTKISTNENFLLISSPLVLLYYLLVNIWIINWKIIEKNIDNKLLYNKIHYINNLYINYRNSLSSSILFPASINMYSGEYVDALIELKISGLTSAHFARYNPILYKMKNDKYKKIDTNLT